MSDINQTILCGRLGQDPERIIKNEELIGVRLNIATAEFISGKEKSRVDTEWHTVKVWSKQAKSCAEMLSQGDTVFVSGRIKSEQWQDENGNPRTTKIIVARDVKFVSLKNKIIPETEAA